MLDGILDRIREEFPGRTVTAVATGALGTRVLVTYLFRYSTLFGHTIIWWNGLFGFGMGFLITWT